jgi:DNA repair protein RadC
MQRMAITDLPRDERPREKLLKQGANSLTDAELLAIFIRTGIPGKSAIEISRDILDQHNGLVNLLSADETAFCATKGLGSATYSQLRAVLEMAKRYQFQRSTEREFMESPDAVKNYIALNMRQRQNEVFACLFLDNRHRVIVYEELFTGTIDSATVHPREVVKAAMRTNAAAVVLAHNHPSGIAEPSQADIDITKKLSKLLSVIDVRVLDHIIVGDGYQTSLAERGEV